MEAEPKVDAEVKVNDNEDLVAELEPIWTQQYNILKLLFQHLKIPDLLSAAKTCKSWSDVAKNVRKKRWNMPYIIPYAPGMHLPPRGIIPTTGTLMARIFSQFNSMDEPNGPTYQEALFDGLQNFSEAQFVILIGTESWQNEQMDRIESSEDNLTEVGQTNLLREAMFCKFPKIVPCLGILASGVATTFSNAVGSIEIEHVAVSVVTCLAIPKVPGLRLKTFTLDKAKRLKYTQRISKVHSDPERKRQVQSDIWRENCEEILNISPEDNVKGILLFHAGPSKNTYVLTAVHEYIRKHPETAMGGGVMYSTITSTPDEPKLTGSGILICCDDENINLCVGSTAMYDGGMTPTNEENLLKFKKNKMDDGTDSFALMFACNGRGFHMHRAENVETTLFQRHYPETPLIGAFTIGEYVHEFVPGEEVIVPEKVKDLEHSFTTVYVFTSWKRTGTTTGPQAAANNSG